MTKIVFISRDCSDTSHSHTFFVQIQFVFSSFSLERVCSVIFFFVCAMASQTSVEIPFVSEDECDRTLQKFIRVGAHLFSETGKRMRPHSDHGFMSSRQHCVSVNGMFTRLDSGNTPRHLLDSSRCLSESESAIV